MECSRGLILIFSLRAAEPPASNATIVIQEKNGVNLQPNHDVPQKNFCDGPLQINHGNFVIRSTMPARSAVALLWH